MLLWDACSRPCWQSAGARLALARAMPRGGHGCAGWSVPVWKGGERDDEACAGRPTLAARVEHACEEEKGVWINASYHHECSYRRESCTDIKLPLSGGATTRRHPQVHTASIAVGVGYSWGGG